MKENNKTTSALDDLFGISKQPRMCNVPLTLLHPFDGHPYKVADDESMTNLVESIRERGIIMPIIAYPVGGDESNLQIISGHRRFHAAEILGMTTVPVRTVFIDRDEAIVQMVDFNLQRDKILPSELAFAYKMKYDAIKRMQKDNVRPVGAQEGNNRMNRSDEKLAEDSNDSARQIQRYIRLTNLVPELLQFVDLGKMKMRPAVELSYLDEEAQRDIVDRIDETESFPSHDQAIRMRKEFADGSLDYDKISDIMNEEKTNQKPTIKFKYEDFGGFFKQSDTPEKIRKDILEGLKLLQKQRKRERDSAR